MPLNFVKKEEIPLRKAPLHEVICQIKFSPILRIAKELPIDFQEAVRNRFPELQIEQGVLLQFPLAVGEDRPRMEASPKVYHFLSPEGKSNVALAADFVAFKTQSYTHWNEFTRDLYLVEEAVRKIFAPAYATRIGLRFINKFTRKNTGCKTFQQIFDLFREEITCLIQADAWQEPDEMISQMVLADKKAKLALRSAYGKEQNEHFFILDFDYYEEGQLKLDDLRIRVNRYHSRIYEAFRWCLKDDSLARFEPMTGV